MDNHDKSGSRPLVLIVDDDAIVSVALKRSLEYLGYEVVIAPDGTQGLEQASRLRPAVVLADVHMPGVDGHALLRRLMHAGSQASVILMSGQGEIEDAIGALREGAVDYLKKPWTLDELTAVVGRARDLFDAFRELSLPPAVARSATRRQSGGTTQSVDASALVEELAGHATAGNLVLPIVSRAVARLREIPPDADRMPDEIAGIIETDPVLSAMVLRMASGTPDLERHSGDIRAVVVAMGRQGIQAAVETVALRDAFPIKVAPLRTLNDRIWRFSVSRALAMRGIADMAEPEAHIDRHQCYLGGLLLDVGASYLLSMISDAMERLDGGIADPAKMTAAIGAHHSRIGSLVLERWEIAPALVALVRDHHADSSPTATPFWCVAALGGAVAVRLAGFDDPTGDRDLRPESLARCAYALGVGDTVLRRLTQSLTENANQIWAACA